MPKRETVAVNYKKIIWLIEKNDWSNAAFARKVGKHNRWLSDVAHGHNLPSPEEAARMCILLNSTPEEILMHDGKDEKETQKCKKDIELVRELVEKQKEAPAAKGEGISAAKKSLLLAIDDLTDEQCEKLLPIVLSAKSVL